MKVVLAFILPFLSLCWWDVGHMLTATVAQIHLKN